MIFIHTLISFLRDREYRELLLTTSGFIGFGTVMYHFLEGWHWIDCLYFSVITLTTIGYGDFSPVTDAGKLFTIFYIILGVGVILSFINTVHHHFQNTRKRKRKELF
jgi:voltage-gated potassium channel